MVPESESLSRGKMLKHRQVYLQNFLKKQLRGLVLFIWLFHTAQVNAEWDAHLVLGENHSLNILPDENFQLLKEHVFQFLKDSWCSEKKLN